MTAPVLGQPDDRPLRDARFEVATVFAPWLAENLAVLSEVVGMPPEFERREGPAAHVYADILAHNPLNDRRRSGRRCASTGGTPADHGATRGTRRTGIWTSRAPTARRPARP